MILTVENMEKIEIKRQQTDERNRDFEILGKPIVQEYILGHSAQFLTYKKTHKLLL